VLKSAAFYPVFFVAICSVFLLHFVISGQAVYGDGIGYYAHVRSWVIDHDLDTTNEYKHIYNKENNNKDTSLSVDTVQIVPTRKDGTAENFYSPGVAILLLPFFTLADAIVRSAALLDIDLHRNGYSDIYQIISGVGALVYMLFALVLVEKLCFFWSKDEQLSRLSVLTIFFATQLLYYGSFDVINSHFASFFLVTLFFFLLFCVKDSASKRFFLGCIAGLALSVRVQEGALVIVFLLFIFAKHSRGAIRYFLAFFCGFVVGAVPFIVHWLYTFGVGEHTYVRSLLRDLSRGRHIDFAGTLFHPINGLFTPTPILFLLFLYFLYLVTQRKAKRYGLLFVFVMLAYCTITLQGGWIAAAYGGRMYISSLVFFALLLVDFLVVLKKTYSIRVLYVFCMLFMIANVLQMGSFIVFKKEASGESRGIEKSTQKRISHILHYLNP
jgi:hypothetical protein